MAKTDSSVRPVRMMGAGDNTENGAGTELSLSSLIAGAGAGESSSLKPFARALGSTRVRVAKTSKMYIGGAFVRSESGRYVQIQRVPGSTASSAAAAGSALESADPDVVNVPRGSRKDVRDAVLAAKNAWATSWARRSAYNRGQIAYRLAEVLEARRTELIASLERSGESLQNATTEVEVAIDRIVFYAGFADKFQALLASSNPVASAARVSMSTPQPIGVVGVMAPPRPSLLGLVSTVLPVVMAGNTCVAIAGEGDPRAAFAFTECLATCDLPGGVVNVLMGLASELAPALATHREVAGIDAWLVDADLRALVERESADSVKRVTTRVPMDPEAWHDDRLGQGLGWIERFVETKTVWHATGF